MPPYNSLNLATHVGDDPDAVAWNRNQLSVVLDLPSEPVWLNQIHGDRIICAEFMQDNNADGIYTDQAGLVCTVMTADCVPVLICNQAGTRIAAVHVGWKGYCADIISNALDLFRDEVSNLRVWIGPHIGRNNYEVGDDVRNACLAKHQELTSAFSQNPRSRWQADLELMVRHTLGLHGISRVVSANLCTYAESAMFYSYRRDGHTGRMASMIWIDRRPSAVPLD